MSGRPLRLLVVMPGWVGDAVMATPALRLLRRSLPGAFIGALCRPGIDELLAGMDMPDEFHVDRAAGVMGPKHAAAKVRPRRYDTALLFTNSFSTALIARIAGIPRRVGYDRDCRGLLLTDRLAAPRRADGSWAMVPACLYYWRAACAIIGEAEDGMPPGVHMELGLTPAQAEGASMILERAEVRGRYAVLNPGGNNEAKRWPADRFAALGENLLNRHGVRVLVNGSPAETDLTDRIASACGGVSLPGLGMTLGALKGIVRGAALMVTNDTGPRHIAAAFGVPLVSLFGPTDHRWTTIPHRPQGPEMIVTADPTLPEHESANDHPERCRMDRITLERVEEAVERVINGAAR
ncbi:MAG: glycosyltransferase family 9 protein [Phycisphaerae bacterium]|nr:glycosyltransferase family 9 protein [Phycisphaerae bacterium]